MNPPQYPTQAAPARRRKRAGLIAGILLVALSLAGLFISAINLMGVESVPEELMRGLQNQAISMMKDQGLTTEQAEEYLGQYLSLKTLSDEEFESLTPEQQEALGPIQQLLPSIVEMAEEKAAKARQRAWIGVAVCSLVFLGGLALIIVDVRQAGA